MPVESRNFVRQLLLEKGSLPEDTELDAYAYLDLGHIDSLALIKFLFRIEEHFSIQFSTDDILGLEIRTVGGLLRLIAAKQSHR
jgi:acyl carrier protein